MVKRICALLLALFLLLPCVQATFVFADTASGKRLFPKNDHDGPFEEIVFRNEKFSDKVASAKIKKSVENIEYAAYLCIDLSHGKSTHDKEKLETLKENYGLKWSLLGLPSELEQIMLVRIPAGDHRTCTHKGWNYDYSKDNGFKDHSKEGTLQTNWTYRKRILLGTVSFECGLTDHLVLRNLSNRHFERCKQCKQLDAFCHLIYNIHILWDHQEDIDSHKGKVSSPNNYTKFDVSEQQIGVVDLINELISLGDDLFLKSSSAWRNGLKINLVRMKEKFTGMSTSFPKQKKFREYAECFSELIEILKENINDLLVQESFFKNTFYET